MGNATTHGHSRPASPTYISWVGMRQRCLYPQHASYAKYGAKGIRVCAQWRDSFPTFLRDMGARPPGTTLDRQDSKGDYEPSNCRWATPKQQSENSDNHGKGWKRLKGHCPAGHPYSAENTRVTAKGHRQCKTCSCQQKKARRAAGSRD